ncbi:MAG: hypothetical protein ACE5F3_08760, partial [Mariprofundaceae bacterium]
MILKRLSIFLLLALFSSAIPVGMAADYNRSTPPAKQISKQKTQATKPARVKRHQAGQPRAFSPSRQAQPAKAS